jgi:hypothetical protein
VSSYKTLPVPSVCSVLLMRCCPLRSGRTAQPGHVPPRVRHGLARVTRQGLGDTLPILGRLEPCRFVVVERGLARFQAALRRYS